MFIVNSCLPNFFKQIRFRQNSPDYAELNFVHFVNPVRFQHPPATNRQRPANAGFLRQSAGD
jgi:hypothetical protein